MSSLKNLIKNFLQNAQFDFSDFGNVEEMEDEITNIIWKYYKKD